MGADKDESEDTAVDLEWPEVPPGLGATVEDSLGESDTAKIKGALSVGVLSTLDDPDRRAFLHVELPPGSILDATYEVEEMIGKGAVGVVYRCSHLKLRRQFAVKVVRAIHPGEGLDAAAVRRLMREARAASSIDHENIVDVMHLGQANDGSFFVVMELLRGENLAQRVDRQHAELDQPSWLPTDEARRIGREILAGLAAAHEAGVVHRDLKPGNVFLADRSGRRVTKLVDFGMSKLLGDDVELTGVGQMIGTPLYMAPEQSRGDPADARADLYSFAVLFYELLAGEVPFPAKSAYDCVVMHLTAEVPPLEDRRPDLPEGVIGLVHRCLAKDPEQRPDSAQAILDGWEALWKGPPVV